MRSAVPGSVTGLLRCCSAHPDRQFPILSDTPETAAVDPDPATGTAPCTYYRLDDRKINK
jgi:hypothetical protein